MHSEATNPYATPKTDACLPEAKIVRENLPIIPPLALWRLAVALVLLTIGWVALWAQMNDHFLFGILIPVICWQRIPKLLNPHGLRRNGGSNLWHGCAGTIRLTNRSPTRSFPPSLRGNHCRVSRIRDSSSLIAQRASHHGF